MPDIWSFIDGRLLLSALSAAAGALFWNFVALHRARVRTLEYSVSHDRVGVSADDAVFGSVAVTWQGNPVTNLFVSTVTVENNTSSDYTDLKLKVWTGSTFLLNERREIPGTTYLPEYTAEYGASIYVAPGVVATPAQQHTYWHSREYMVPVLNRKQRVVFTFLTTVPNSTEGPSAWVDILHSGVGVRFRPVEQRIHGVPVRIALPVGLVASIVIAVLTILVATKVWVAAVVCLFVGFVAQSVGAALYRLWRLVAKVLFR
jgi:hypothetical protein